MRRLLLLRVIFELLLLAIFYGILCVIGIRLGVGGNLVFDGD